MTDETITVRAIGEVEALEQFVRILERLAVGGFSASRPLKNERDPGYRVYMNLNLCQHAVPDQTGALNCTRSDGFVAFCGRPCPYEGGEMNGKEDR